jgi:hypothetical protein
MESLDLKEELGVNAAMSDGPDSEGAMRRVAEHKCSSSWCCEQRKSTRFGFETFD